MAKFYYAVKEGRKTGVYTDWNECKKQVNGYKGAIYKKFKKESEALAFVNGGAKKKDIETDNDLEKESMNDRILIYVDGSYNADTKESGWGFVVTKNDEKLYENYGTLSPERIDTSQRNVLGEIFGALFAEKYARENGMESIVIVHDYIGLSSWVDGSFKANNEITQTYRDIMQNSPIKITFKKVEAHTGVTWNERADVLAKKGANVA